MSTLLVHGGPVWTPFQGIDDGAVFARDGVVEFAGRRGDAPEAHADVEIDAGGRLVCPGFIDLQVNGGGGVVFTDQPDLDALERMTRAHVRFGTTAVLPTVCTSPEESMMRALDTVRQAVALPARGARVLGAHLEGPFINPVRRGAHDERLIVPPDPALFERLARAGGGALRLITLAPELPGALELIAAARADGVVASLGHSDATYDEALAAIAEGASFGTHLFNGMRPLHHREPGVIGALFRAHHVVCGLIADYVHVHPVLLEAAFRMKGASGVALVTDALATPGDDGSPGVEVRDGACYLADGTLAGSALTMNQAIWRMSDATGAGLIDCVQMATSTPAAVIGLEEELGLLAPGARADIVICDRRMEVWKVLVGGEVMYDAAADGEGGAP